MRFFVLPALAVLALAAIAFPQSAKSDQKLSNNRHYHARSGDRVHSPATTPDQKPPKGATAQCRDGSWSFSESHRGECSRHGGVKRWLG